MMQMRTSLTRLYWNSNLHMAKKDGKAAGRSTKKYRCKKEQAQLKKADTRLPGMINAKERALLQKTGLKVVYKKFVL
jgi:hypothetical protein